MKWTRYTWAALLAASAFGQTAMADPNPGTHHYYQGNSALISARVDDSQPAPAAEPAPAGDCAACEAAEEEEETCDPWRLFNQDTCSGIKVYGFVNGGYFTNTRNTASKYNGPVTFADRTDGQLNQMYGIVEKNIDTGGCGWDFGGRLDVLYGSDWIYNTEIGWETDQTGALLNGWNSSPYYGLVTTQAYAEIGYNDLSVKVGRFYTPIGYEVVPATGNFFATHAYTMQYGEPFSHTGALATYKANDNWTLIGGLVNGWDRFDGVTDRVGGIGGVIYTPDHEKYTLTLTGISSTDGAFNSGLQTTRSLYSFVFSYNVTDNWTYVFQHDHGWQDGTLAVPGGALQDAEWYGINQYLFYTINDCWKAGLRAEWFRDDDGVRVAGVRPDNLANGDTGNVTATPGGYAGNFYEVSLGLNWTPHANLIVRPEVRYDWYEGIGTPFGDNTASSQWVYGLDAVVLW